MCGELSSVVVTTPKSGMRIRQFKPVKDDSRVEDEGGNFTEDKPRNQSTFLVDFELKYA